MNEDLDKARFRLEAIRQLEEQKRTQIQKQKLLSDPSFIDGSLDRINKSEK